MRRPSSRAYVWYTRTHTSVRQNHTDSHTVMRTSKKKEFPVHILFRNIIINILYDHTIHYNDIFISWFAGVWTNARVNRSLSCVYIMLVHFMGGIRKCVSAVLCRCVTRYSSQGSLLPSNGIKYSSRDVGTESWTMLWVCVNISSRNILVTSTYFIPIL